MEVVGIICGSCGDFVYSRTRHDMRYCSCKAVAADGGQSGEYLRVLGSGAEQAKRDIPNVELNDNITDGP